MPVFTCAKKLGFESKQLHKIDYFTPKNEFFLSKQLSKHKSIVSTQNLILTTKKSKKYI